MKIRYSASFTKVLYHVNLLQLKKYICIKVYLVHYLQEF